MITEFEKSHAIPHVILPLNFVRRHFIRGEEASVEKKRSDNSHGNSHVNYLRSSYSEEVVRAIRAPGRTLGRLCLKNETALTRSRAL
jgi:hypothetical protein